eukprot:scaffold10022_cov170-Amphora_coffeaeformis.AAC.7
MIETGRASLFHCSRLLGWGWQRNSVQQVGFVVFFLEPSGTMRVRIYCTGKGTKIGQTCRTVLKAHPVGQFHGIPLFVTVQFAEDVVKVATEDS